MVVGGAEGGALVRGPGGPVIGQVLPGPEPVVGGGLFLSAGATAGLAPQGAPGVRVLRGEDRLGLEFLQALRGQGGSEAGGLPDGAAALGDGLGRLFQAGEAGLQGLAPQLAVGGLPRRPVPGAGEALTRRLVALDLRHEPLIGVVAEQGLRLGGQPGQFILGSLALRHQGHQVGKGPQAVVQGHELAFPQVLDDALVLLLAVVGLALLGELVLEHPQPQAPGLAPQHGLHRRQARHGAAGGEHAVGGDGALLPQQLVLAVHP